MKKLEFKHLAPYLPYSLQIYNEISSTKCVTLRNLSIDTPRWRLDDIKPILHPLSDLTKEIKHNGERFVPIEELAELYIALYNTPPNRAEEERELFVKQKTWSINQGMLFKHAYWLNNKLFEWHFDVFGLIDNGLAIDINKLA